MVDENAAHQLRRDAEEMRAVAPLDAPLVDQSKVRLVHERRGLQRVSRTFTPHRAARLTMQLRIDDAKQPIRNRLIAPAPGEKQLSDLGRRKVRPVMLR
jgi:hypothetical protein